MTCKRGWNISNLAICLIGVSVKLSHSGCEVAKNYIRINLLSVLLSLPLPNGILNVATEIVAERFSCQKRVRGCRDDEILDYEVIAWNFETMPSSHALKHHSV